VGRKIPCFLDKETGCIRGFPGKGTRPEEKEIDEECDATAAE
jgi:hypothetical protein